MCGIAVTVDLPPNPGGGTVPTARELTQVMVERLRRRGPDDTSVQMIPQDDKDRLLGPTVVLGHTRLAIVGGEAAKSPFHWSKGEKRFSLIHNGEIYNHDELKEGLVREGCCKARDFSTECDSEVLLACCAHRGVEWTLQHVKGMFAFVLVEWTQSRISNNNSDSSDVHVSAVVVDRVVVARDTFGIKPLCYAMDKGRERIILASQVEAIPRGCGLDQDCMELRDILPSTHTEFIFHRQNIGQINGTAEWDIETVSHPFVSCDLGPRPWWPTNEAESPRKGNTLLDSKKFSLGEKLVGALRSCIPPWWQTHETILPPEENILFLETSALHVLRTKLIEAVRSRIPPRGTCPAAVLLSGGLDSSLITAIAAHLSEDRPLHTFNISFREEETDLSPELDCCYARLVAEHISNVYHEEVSFSFKEGIEALPAVIRCLETYDAVSVRAGIPLYLLSKHIASSGFKVVLCGEGADESMAGYRLFENFLPSSSAQRSAFLQELDRRLMHIDTSELHRVDRCTSAHGLEARVPFLDLDFIAHIMSFPALDKMAHHSLGRIQKYILRRAFDSSCNEASCWLPDAILFREKEQFADGIGRGWVRSIQNYAVSVNGEGILDGERAEKALYKNIFFEDEELLHLDSEVRGKLVEARQTRRQKHQCIGPGSKAVCPGSAQPSRWHSVSHDPDLQHLVSKEEACLFLESVLAWPSADVEDFEPTLTCLNRLIVSMLERVPFHNLTLLVRERRAPTLEEIKQDMMSGLGGPCSVVNSFFASFLLALGFGPNLYLLGCEILGREGCHVAILVQIKGLRYFVDVANAKPYCEAVHLGDSSIKMALNNSFEWNLSYNFKTKRHELMHSGKVALSFDPSKTFTFRSFRPMITRSRSDESFGPFLYSLRICLFPSKVSSIMAIRDATIYEGESMNTENKRQATMRSDIIETFAKSHKFAHIARFVPMVQTALDVLNTERPNWFEKAVAK